VGEKEYMFLREGGDVRSWGTDFLASPGVRGERCDRATKGEGRGGFCKKAGEF